MQPSPAENATLSLQNGNCINDSVKVEEGKSGQYAENRPAFLAMMEFCKSGKADVLIVHKVDRFSRMKIVETYQALEELENAKIRFVAVADRIDTMTPTTDENVLKEASKANGFIQNLKGEVRKGQIAGAECNMHM